MKNKKNQKFYIFIPLISLCILFTILVLVVPQIGKALSKRADDQYFEFTYAIDEAKYKDFLDRNAHDGLIYTDYSVDEIEYYKKFNDFTIYVDLLVEDNFEELAGLSYIHGLMLRLSDYESVSSLEADMDKAKDKVFTIIIDEYIAESELKELCKKTFLIIFTEDVYDLIDYEIPKCKYAKIYDNPDSTENNKKFQSETRDDLKFINGVPVVPFCMFEWIPLED